MNESCEFQRLDRGELFMFENRLYKKSGDDRADLIKDELGYEPLKPRFHQFYPDEDVMKTSCVDSVTKPSTML
ncbi:MAG: hypothetical protein AAGG48_29350 [Planctomycetota bacterium]